MLFDVVFFLSLIQIEVSHSFRLFCGMTGFILFSSAYTEPLYMLVQMETDHKLQTLDSKTGKNKLEARISYGPSRSLLYNTHNQYH